MVNNREVLIKVAEKEHQTEILEDRQEAQPPQR